MIKLDLSQYSRLWVAFSGGLDSSVLLHNLHQYKDSLPPIQAIHVNHGLSKNADLWQTHCEQFCQQISIPLHCYSADFDRNSNIEEGARDARYVIFAKLIQSHEALLVAHHANDQAETLLLQLFRGSGVDGMAAMPATMPFAEGMIIRPLLDYSRQQLETYAQLHCLNCIEDESNSDEKYARNYIRNTIFPILQKKWPGVLTNITRTAKHCQDAKKNLDVLAIHDFGLIDSTKPILPLAFLSTLPPEQKINCLRFWLKKNNIRMPSTGIIQRIDKEIIAARPDRNPEVKFGRYIIRRYQETLFLMQQDQNSPENRIWFSFPEPLDLGFCKIENPGLEVAKNSVVEVRFRDGGEVIYWNGQHKSVKKLMQEWKIPPWLRNRIPLIYVDNVLVRIVI